MILALFDPTLQAVFWSLALIAYAVGAVTAVIQRQVTAITVGSTALGLALWHFPQLWNLWETV